MSELALTRLRLENFTAFKELDVEFSPGLNVFIGGNSTGKTHILKVLYAGCDITLTGEALAMKLLKAFLPSSNDFGKLLHRGSSDGKVEIFRDVHRNGVEIFCVSGRFAFAWVSGSQAPWYGKAMPWAFIPAKDMLANVPEFLVLYDKQKVPIETFYTDILEQACRDPLPTETIAQPFLDVLGRIEKLIGGQVEVEGEQFFRRKNDWKLEFTLLAEGYRKLGLLWLLIRNGTIAKESILFWDEPETNLNPSMLRDLVAILLELQRLGVQIFLATHSYVVFKEFDLQKEESDRVRFFSLFREDEEEGVSCAVTEDVDLVDPNVILETFVDLYDRDVERSLDQGGEL
jgi:hypothetical protein